jgi:DNA-binding response OmpR family regulator
MTRPAPNESRSAAHPPVLLVDDDIDILDSLTELLRLSGFDVMTAHNGQEALTQARSKRPCVVILDLMMPVMSGQEFRRQQSSDPEISNVPVIVVTAARPTTSELANLGATECLLKPVDLDRLVALVRRLC